MLGYHLLGIELPVAQVTLEVRAAVYLLVLGEIARIAEAFVAERAFV